MLNQKAVRILHHLELVRETAEAADVLENLCLCFQWLSKGVAACMYVHEFVK